MFIILLTTCATLCYALLRRRTRQGFSVKKWLWLQVIALQGVELSWLATVGFQAWVQQTREQNSVVFIFLAFMTVAAAQAERYGKRRFSIPVLLLQSLVALLVLSWFNGLHLFAAWLCVPVFHVLNRMDFGRSMGVSRSHGSSHLYESSVVNIELNPASDSFSVVFTGKRCSFRAKKPELVALDKDNKPSGQRVALPFSAADLPIVQTTEAGNRIGLECSSEIITKLHTPYSSQSTYIPGTVSTGYDNQGNAVTFTTPGQTVTTSVPSGPSMDLPTDYVTARVRARVRDVWYQYTIHGMHKDAYAQLEKMVALLREHGETLIQLKREQWTARMRLEQETAEKQRVEELAKERAAAADRLDRAVKERLVSAGFVGDDVFLWFDSSPDGTLLELIAADRQGQGLIYTRQGDCQWVGSWRQAEVGLRDGRLCLKVEDEAFRRRELAERRFTLMGKAKESERQTWADRVNLLSSG